MDLQTEQAVWRRVKGPGSLTAEEAVLPERLEALILEERARAQELRGLSRRLRGPESGKLTRLAAQSEARARALTALHYLLTGRRLRLQTPRPPKPSPLPEALRQAALTMRQTAKAYESLGVEFADNAEDFERFADETRTGARRLTAVLQGQLGPR